MNAVARAQLTFQMLTLLQKYIPRKMACRFMGTVLSNAISADGQVKERYDWYMEKQNWIQLHKIMQNA